MNQDKPIIGRVRLESGVELEIHADSTGAYVQDPNGERYPLEMRCEPSDLALIGQNCGFSIRGTVQADDPGNIEIESFQMVPISAEEAFRRARQTGSMLALGTLVPAEELRESIEPEEWTYAAPSAESCSRQAFKDIANKSSWSRHDGTKRRRRHR